MHQLVKKKLITFIIVVNLSFKQDTKSGESMHSAVQCIERTAEYCRCNEWQFYTASVTTSVSCR
jgi:hypothetical protein